MRIAILLLLHLAAAAGITMPAAAQTFTLFPIPSHPALPEGITTGPDGALWFTEYAGGRIGRITTRGEITEFPTITINSNPRSIITGPDGALWFTEEGAKKIGRIPITATATNPQLDEFPVPSSGRPFGITTAPDGVIWFSNSGYVGRVTTDGDVTNEFGFGGYGVTMGPDEALWIAGRQFIYTVRTQGVAGVLSKFPIKSPAYRITTGPDGALWFTENENAKIGRITIDGGITEYAVPKDGLPGGITTGPDGALWFTEYSQRSKGSRIGYNKIGRITTDGKITEYTIPNPADPTGWVNPAEITMGPDRALWFTASSRGDGKIGRLQLP
jgi:virginiamycin B lyase